MSTFNVRIHIVWVSKRRKNGIAAAEKAGAQVVLLDDGFQDPSFHKDFQFWWLMEREASEIKMPSRGTTEKISSRF